MPMPLRTESMRKDTKTRGNHRLRQIEAQIEELQRWKLALQLLAEQGTPLTREAILASLEKQRRRRAPS